MSHASHPQTAAKERAILLTLGAVQFTNILDFMIIMPLGPQLMRGFGITPAQFSHLTAAYGIAAAVSGFIGGFFLDRFDRKRALLMAYAGFALTTLWCGLAPTHHWLLAARLAAGAFGGLSSSLISAMVGDVVPPGRRGRAMSFVMSAFPFASVLGIPAGLSLAAKFGWHAPFFLLAACAAANLLLASIVLPHLSTAIHGHDPRRQMKEILTHPVYRRALGLGSVLIMGGNCLIPFLAASMVANMGLPEGRLQVAYAVGGVCTFVSMPIVGWLSDHVNRLHLLTWVSIATSVVALVLTRLGPVSLPFSCAMMALFMVTMSGRFAPAMTMVTNAVDARHRGGFMSVNSALQQAAGSAANMIAGFFVTSDATGHLVGYPLLGNVAAGFFALTVLLGFYLTSAAPHVAAPGHHTPIPVAVVD